MAKDVELQEALKQPSVRKAIAHWTNEKRMSTEEANKLMDSDSYDFKYYIKPTLDKLQWLQQLCRQAGIGVPMDAVLEGRSNFISDFHSADEEGSGDTDQQATSSTAREEIEDEAKPDEYWVNLGENLGRQFTLAVIVLIFTIFMMPPPPESPVYLIPGAKLLLR